MHEVRFTNPKVAERIAEWKSGRAQFDLSYCDLTSDDLEQLGCDDIVTSRIWFVPMHGNPAELWVDGIHALARFKKFKGVSVKDCDLGQVREMGRRLGDGLKRCEPFVGLALAFNGLDAEQLVPLFERLPFLLSLDLCGNDFDELDSLAGAMRSLTRLHGLKLGFNPFERIAPLLTACVLQKIDQLYLWECENLIDADALGSLACDNGGNLQFVDLRGCSAWQERLRNDPRLLGVGGMNSAGKPLLSVN